MSRRGSILVVDDSAEMRDSLEDLLRLEGYSVVSIPDAEGALRLLRNPDNHFSLVLLDLNMPGMNPLDLLEEKVKDPRLESLPVIIMTAYTDAEVKLQAGVVGFITKGQQIDPLLSLVRHFCQR